MRFLLVGLLLTPGCITWITGINDTLNPPYALGPYTESIGKVTFEMLPVHGACIWMGKTEVTWAEYENYYFDEEADAIARPSPSYHPHDKGWGRGQRPAVGISRQAAERYCEWISMETGKTYRLPTENEWERACGPDPQPLSDYAWVGQERTQPVGGKQPNALGFFDMLGNAWEYCSGGDEPVMRGGCWKDATAGLQSRRTVPFEWNERDPQRPRSIWWLADGEFVGFRVVRSAR